MWRDRDNMERSFDGESDYAEPLGPEDEIFSTLAELNEQCLEVMTEQAALRAPNAPPMFRDLADLWRQLDVGARRRAAACPFLLVDAGFADPYRWRWVSKQGTAASDQTQRAPPADAIAASPRARGTTGTGIDSGTHVQSGVSGATRFGSHVSSHVGSAPAFRAHAISDREPLSYTALLPASSAVRVAHQVFTNAWYIVRAQPTGAPLFLGMPPQCAALLRACSIRQITELANQHSGWLRPRWAGRANIWRDLLASAIADDGHALEMARLHGVQLLAMELRALDQVQG